MKKVVENRRDVILNAAKNCILKYDANLWNREREEFLHLEFAHLNICTMKVTLKIISVTKWYLS